MNKKNHFKIATWNYNFSNKSLKTLIDNADNFINLIHLDLSHHEM